MILTYYNLIITHFYTVTNLYFKASSNAEAITICAQQVVVIRQQSHCQKYALCLNLFLFNLQLKDPVIPAQAR